MNNTVLLVHYLTKADLAGLPSSWIFHMVPDVSGPFLWANLFLKGFSNLTVKGTVVRPKSKNLAGDESVWAYNSLDLSSLTGQTSPTPGNWWQ